MLDIAKVDALDLLVETRAAVKLVDHMLDLLGPCAHSALNYNR